MRKNSSTECTRFFENMAFEANRSKMKKFIIILPIVQPINILTQKDLKSILPYSIMKNQSLRIKKIFST